VGEPREIDEPVADHLVAMQRARDQRRLVGVEHDPPQREQAHEREQRVEHAAQPALVGNDDVEAL
jgi:hypothetical protein